MNVPTDLAKRNHNTGTFAIVRDKNGKPKFDDIYNIPQGFWNSLTTEEQEVIKNERNAS